MRAFRSLVELLEHRAGDQAEDVAFGFISDRGERAGELTYLGLWGRAAGLAGELRALAQKNDRVLLVYPPGIEFLVGYFGCLMAGVVPTPLMVPRRAVARDASESILADCEPRLVLTVSSMLAPGADLRDKMTPFPRDAFIATDLIAAQDPPHPVAPRLSDLALLQYTSGSTSAPRGVQVSHANLLANLEMIRRAFGNTRSSAIVSWTPLYHDMGLILNALQAVYVGAPCLLMAPVSFIQRPMIWLEAIFKHRIEVAGCPNFGFDHCVDRLRPGKVENLDLSSWRVAFNGAEPVRAETLERFARAFAPYGFRASSFYPCYGMAEATLLISGGVRGRGALTRRLDTASLQKGRAASATGDAGQALVACGRALDQEQIAIVDPRRQRRAAADAIGEIWVSGPHVAQGYFERDELSEASFRARLPGEERAWLRTGDLGFLDAEGNLFVAGRIKDLIIIRGANHYPQDIERTVEECHPALRKHGGAAFSIEGARGEERLVIVQEVERTRRRTLDLKEIEDRIREAVAEAHEISTHEIALIQPGSLPKTTSGKIQRGRARSLFLEGRLDLVEGSPSLEAAAVP